VKYSFKRIWGINSTLKTLLAIIIKIYPMEMMEKEEGKLPIRYACLLTIAKDFLRYRKEV
jgi:hypothetical protein